MKIFILWFFLMSSCIFSQQNWIQEISLTREQKVLFKNHMDEFRPQMRELQESLIKINTEFQNTFINSSKEDEIIQILNKKNEIERKIQEIKNAEIIKIWGMLTLEQRKIFSSYLPHMMEQKQRGKGFQNKKLK